MSQNEKNIAEIIPAVKLPRDLTQFFSYQIPENLKNEIAVGSVAKIPFRKKEILGIVHSFSQAASSEFNIKEIKEIVKELELSKEQLEMAQFISEYYFSPLGIVAKLMLPDIAKKESRKEIDLNRDFQVKETNKSVREKVNATLQIEKHALLIHSLESQRHELYKDIIRAHGNTGQTLLMLPEYFDIWNFAGYYIKTFGKENVAILCSDITKNQYFKEWQKTKTGSAKLIISTRQGVFAPFKNLKLIIADDEHNSSYKQWDQNPRYHGIIAAIKLAEIHKAKIILSSPVPSPESYSKCKDNFAKIDISEKFKIDPQFADFDTERKNGNYSLISEKLRQSLLEKIYAKKQALVLIPKLGEKTFHQCRDCSLIIECETCQNALIGYKNKLYCPRCKQFYEPIKSCPKCRSNNIGAFGGGSQRVFEEISKLFEGKNINISELDSTTAKDSKQSRKICENFRKGKIDILIGTQMAWKNWAMENLELIGIIFPEIIFNIPGFRSKEKSWQFLEKTYSLAQSKNIIIETYKPQHKYFEEIKNKSAENFLHEELQSRSAEFSQIPYPPLGKLIKLIYKNPSPLACEREAKWQYEVLQKEIFKNGLKNTFEIMPPFPAQGFREYGKYRWHIIIKYKNQTAAETRNQVLKVVRNDWIIDIDPDEIL